jgi:hypothetical protein
VTDPIPEPWDSPGPLFDSVTWCDACGEAVEPGAAVALEAVPVDVAAANRGESATLCGRCAADVRAIAEGRA